MKKNKYLTFLDNKELSPFVDDDSNYLGIRLKLALDNLNLSTGLVAILSNDYSFYFFRNQLFFRNPSFIESFSSSLGLYLEKFEHTDSNIAYQLIVENSKRNIAPPMIKNKKTGEYEIITGYRDPYQLEFIDIRNHRLNVRDISKISEIEWIMLNSPVFMRPVFRDLRECLIHSLKNQVIKNIYNMSRITISKECQLKYLENALNHHFEQLIQTRISYLRGLKEIEMKFDMNFKESYKQLEDVLHCLNSLNNIKFLSRKGLENWLEQEVNFQKLFEKEVLNNGYFRL